MKKNKKSESNYVKPNYWIDDPVNSAEKRLSEIKDLESRLMKEGKLVSVSLSDGTILTTTKSSIEEKLKKYN